MALRPGTVTRLTEPTARLAGPSGIVLALSGSELVLADAQAAAWLNETGGNFTLDDTESNRDGALFSFGTEVEVIYGL